MNIPKVIRSLNSYFIRTTSHLCMMEGQRPCSDTIVPCHYGNISTTFTRNLLMFYFQFDLFKTFSMHIPAACQKEIIPKCSSNIFKPIKTNIIPPASSAFDLNLVPNIFPILTPIMDKANVVIPIKETAGTMLT